MQRLLMMRINPNFLEEYANKFCEEKDEEDLEVRFLETVLLKIYTQKTKTEFMNTRSQIFDYLNLYNNLGKPADMEKLIEIFGLTENEENKLKQEFSNYPNLYKKDIGKICKDINERLQKYRFELHSVK